MITDIYLDVDGVIVPCFDPAVGVDSKASGFRDWHGQSWTHGRDEPVRGLLAWSPRQVAAIAEIGALDGVQVWWCTTWGERARDELAPAIRLPKFPVLDEDRRHLLAEADNVTPSSWWKRDAVQEHHAANPDHRVVWIDDDLGYDEKARLWMRSLGDRGLSVTPDTTVGLTRRDLDRIRAFILR